MEFLKSWFISFVSVVILVSIFKMVLSKSRLKSTTNIIYSLLILSYAITPFLSFISNENSFDFHMDFSECYDYESDSYEMVIENSIKVLCSKNKIDVIDIKIDSYIDNETNDIIVKQILIKIKDKSKVDFLKEYIQDELGFEVHVC